jgi:hypothetical protein
MSEDLPMSRALVVRLHTAIAACLHRHPRVAPPSRIPSTARSRHATPGRATDRAPILFSRVAMEQGRWKSSLQSHESGEWLIGTSSGSSARVRRLDVAGPRSGDWWPLEGGAATWAAVHLQLTRAGHARLLMGSQDAALLVILIGFRRRRRLQAGRRQRGRREAAGAGRREQATSAGSRPRTQGGGRQRLGSGDLGCREQERRRWGFGGKWAVT